MVPTEPIRGVVVELWELSAREEIRDLVARYNANGDTGRFPQVLELFAPDAVMHTGERLHGPRRDHRDLHRRARPHP
ncbi:MAG: nuclear transport factor 2 family protein [Acidimicrobiia bacterium]